VERVERWRERRAGREVERGRAWEERRMERGR
jgi:hypothetical protein